MKNLSRKRISIILIIYALIFNLVGGTLAYWNWESENTLITFSVDEAFMCSADVGGDINPENVSLAPALCTSEKNAIKKRLVVYPTVLGDFAVGLDLWLEINSIAPELSATENFKYALTTDENSCTNNVVATGSFTGKEAGDTVELLKQQIYRESIYEGEEYWLYIWLDAAETSLSTANKSFNFVLNGTCKDHFEGYNYLINFNANGGVTETTTYTTVGEHTYAVPEDGTYKLEVWGAQGGVRVAGGTSTTGYGGYSIGMINLNAGDNLYLNIGGAGKTTSSKGTIVTGGYNGGGNGYSYSGDSRGGASGGGATHISTKSGILSTLSSSLSDVLIVAGGGGGSAQCCDGYHKEPGSGGGYVGVAGYYNGVSNSSGGTQTAGGLGSFAGSYGAGGSCSSDDCAGGGGGLYGGGAEIGGGGYGAGGSGYIGNSLLTNKAMYCYGCTTSSDASTLTYSTTNVSATPTANYAKSGDGAAKISKLSSFKGVVVGDTYGTLPIPTRNGYVFLEWNTESDGSGQTITNTSVVDITSDQTLYAIWELSMYTVSYDANGGTGAPASQSENFGTDLTISSTTPTRSGYVFLGWSTSSSATSATYSVGGTYTGNTDVTLYAVWKLSESVTSYASSLSQGYSYSGESFSYSSGNALAGGNGYYYVYGLRFTTPNFTGTSSKIVFEMQFIKASYTNSDFRYALLSSDINISNYHNTGNAVSDANQIANGIWSLRELNDSYKSYSLTIDTTLLNPNTTYYLVLWDYFGGYEYAAEVAPPNYHSITITSQ